MVRLMVLGSHRANSNVGLPVPCLLALILSTIAGEISADYEETVWRAIIRMCIVLQCLAESQYATSTTGFTSPSAAAFRVSDSPMPTVRSAALVSLWTR